MENSQDVTEQIIYNSVLWWERCLNFWIDGFCTSQSHGFRERIIYIQKLWSHSWDLPVPTISLPSTIPVWPISFSSTTGAPEIASGMCWITQRKWCIAVSGIWQYRKPHWSKLLFTAQHDYTRILSQWSYVCFPVLNRGFLPSQSPAQNPSDNENLTGRRSTGRGFPGQPTLSAECNYNNSLISKFQLHLHLGNQACQSQTLFLNGSWGFIANTTDGVVLSPAWPK